MVSSSSKLLGYHNLLDFPVAKQLHDWFCPLQEALLHNIPCELRLPYLSMSDFHLFQHALILWHDYQFLFFPESA